MFLIGDPKQAIYSFRGADVFAYLRAARDARGHGATRSTPTIAPPRPARRRQHALRPRGRPFLLGDIAFAPVEPAPGAAERLQARAARAPPARILFARREPRRDGAIPKGWAHRHLPDAIAADVARLLQSGATIDGRAVSAGDVAVLVRKNRQAVAVQEALRAVRVPSVLQGDASVFDAPEALEVQQIMAALVDAGARRRAVRLALATSVLGLDAAEIHALEGDDAAWDELARRAFARGASAGRISGFVGAPSGSSSTSSDAAPRLLAPRRRRAPAHQRAPPRRAAPRGRRRASTSARAGSSAGSP